jgi:hypothetical protein
MDGRSGARRRLESEGAEPARLMYADFWRSIPAARVIDI